MSDDRIHAWLDGDLPLESLSDDEREEALALRSFLDAAAAPLRAERAPSDLATRVMAALPPVAVVAEPGRRSAAREVLEWLWNPRPIRLAFRPAYGVAFAGVAAAALALPRGHVPAPAGPEALPVAVAHAAPPVYVQFRIRVPDARRVQLAGTFTGWKPAVSLTRSNTGEWTALVPLRPGVHDYAFVVDGDRWVSDPNAPQVDDSFGGTNSRISLPPIGAT